VVPGRSLSQDDRTDLPRLVDEYVRIWALAWRGSVCRRSFIDLGGRWTRRVEVYLGVGGNVQAESGRPSEDEIGSPEDED
jgi:hypothetical protein